MKSCVSGARWLGVVLSKRSIVLLAATLFPAVLSDAAAPWNATISSAEHTMTLYFLVVAALAFIAGFVRAWDTRTEVGARYRTAVVARLGIMSIALLSYVLLIFEFVCGYRQSSAGWVPTPDAMIVSSLRYMDWSLTVPLLAVELLAVCTLLGGHARRVRSVAVGGSFLMIFTGFLGEVIIGAGENIFQMVLWGAISCVFWVTTTVVLVLAVRTSLPQLTAEASALLRRATLLLLGGWFIYPSVYVMQIVWSGGAISTATQIIFTVADVVIKLGFAGLIHRVAKLRTAEDVRAGYDIHPEAIWISSIKQSDAGLPVVVYLAAGAAVHRERSRPANSAAVAVPVEEHGSVSEL